MKLIEVILLTIILCGFLCIHPCIMNIEGIKGESLVKKGRQLVQNGELLVKEDLKKGKQLVQKAESLVKEGESQLKGYAKGLSQSSTGNVLLGEGDEDELISGYPLIKVPDNTNFNLYPIMVKSGVCFHNPDNPFSRTDDRTCSQIDTESECTYPFCNSVMGHAGSDSCGSACEWQETEETYYKDTNYDCGWVERDWITDIPPMAKMKQSVVRLRKQIKPETWFGLSPPQYLGTTPLKRCIAPGLVKSDTDKISDEELTKALWPVSPLNSTNW